MKYLQTMVRIGDLDKSLDFHYNKLGLEQIGRFDKVPLLSMPHSRHW